MQRYKITQISLIFWELTRYSPPFFNRMEPEVLAFGRSAFPTRAVAPREVQHTTGTIRRQSARRSAPPPCSGRGDLQRRWQLPRAAEPPAPQSAAPHSEERTRRRGATMELCDSAGYSPTEFTHRYRQHRATVLQIVEPHRLKPRELWCGFAREPMHTTRQLSLVQRDLPMAKATCLITAQEEFIINFNCLYLIYYKSLERTNMLAKPKIDFKKKVS